jgi:hypothetical protein
VLGETEAWAEIDRLGKRRRHRSRGEMGELRRLALPAAPRRPRAPVLSHRRIARVQSPLPSRRTRVCHCGGDSGNRLVPDGEAR